MDQRLRHSRLDIPALQKVRELVITVAHVSPHLHNLPPRQRLPGLGTLHTTRW